MPQVVVGAALSTGVSAALLTTAQLTALGGLGTIFAQNLVLGAISYALQDKPKMAETGLNIGNVREPVSPRKVIYGETRVGGTYLFVDTSEVVWAVLATSSEQLPSDHPDYYDSDGGNQFNATDNPITYGSGVTINGSTYYLATDADGRQCYMTSNTQSYGVIGYYRPRRHNEFFQYVTAIAGHEVEDITDIYFEDEHLATFDASGLAATLESGVTRFDSDGGRQTPFFKSRKGTSSQSAFDEMQDNIPFGSYVNTGAGSHRGWTRNNADALVGRNLKYVDSSTQPKDFTDYESVGQAWSSAHQCKDTAIVYGRLAYNPNVYINGLPKVTYRVKGKKLYDPRTLTTAYGNNAALCILDYLMDDKYGLGVSTDEINMQSFEDAADVCDEDVTLAAGGTEKRYTINGVIDTSLTPRDVLENMLTACAGKLVYVNGQFTLYAAEYRTPNVSIDEDDIISSISVSTKNSNRSNYNGVKGQFSDPDSNPPFIATEYPVVTSAAFETIDGKQSYTTLDLPFTTSSATAQRLAKLLLNRSRQEITISFKAKLSAINVTAGDTISVTNSRLGFSSKTFEVTSSQLGFDGTSMFVGITATEVTSATFDWNADESAIITNGWTDYRQFTIPAPTDLTITTDVTVQTDGTAVGGVTLSWAAALSENIIGYELQWRVSTDTDYQSTTTGETTFAGYGQFITGATYNVRVRSLTRNGGFSDWTETTVDMPDDAIAPSAPSGLTATGGAGFITLDWTGNTENDLAGYEVYENSSNDSGTATQIAKVTADQFTRGGIAYSATRYYWVKAYDFSGNASAFSSVASASTNAAPLDGTDGADGADGQDAAGLYTYDIAGTTSGLESDTTTLNGYFSTASSNKTKVNGDTLIVQKTDNSEATAYIYNGSTWDEQTGGYFSGDVLIDGTLTVSALKSGYIDNGYGYFSFADGTTVDGYNGVIETKSTNSSIAAAVFAGENTAAVLAGTYSSTDSAAVFVNATNSTYTSFNSAVNLATPETPTIGSTTYNLSLDTEGAGGGYSAWRDGSTYVMYGGRATYSRTSMTYANPSITSAPVLTNYGNTSSADSAAAFDTGFYYNYSTNTVHFPNSASPFTGSHEALIATGTSIEVGDICVDVEVIEREGVSNVLTRVEKSSAANQAAAIGVFVTTADIIPEVLRVVTQTETEDLPPDEMQDDVVISIKEGFEQAMTDNDVCLVNALGEGQVNVCGENGDIAVGDLIVTSNTAGKGMKQDDDIIRSYTVAKAREAVTFNSASDTAQIACIYLCG